MRRWCVIEREAIVLKRLALFFACALFLLLPTSVAAAECQFVLGFATLRDLIGHDIVGACLENQHHCANGDGRQQTTGGMLVWRKADNWTAFTDGYRTWISGPNGLEQRLNTERFEWEADYAPGGGIATPTPTPTPAATATPIHSITPSPTATLLPVSDSSLAELASASAWYRDGLDEHESLAFTFLNQIDRFNPQAARTMSRWPWIFDEDMREDEYNVISTINSLVLNAPELVPHIVALSWIADGIERWERRAVSFLKFTVADKDLDFAIELATAPWVVDGLTIVESEYGIVQLKTLSGGSLIPNSSPELARRVMSLIPYSPREVDFFLVYALRDIALYNPDGLERLLRAPWFRDGLDEKERIYLIAAGATRLDADQLFDPYSIASATMTLPHTGVVNLWVVHQLPNRIGRVTLANLERAVRDSEQFWGIPFPVDDVILSMLIGPYSQNIHLRNIMLISPHSVDPAVIHHETAHYYFRFGPTWFDEGGATYIENYFTTAGEDIPTVSIPDFCWEQGADNLQALIELDINNPVWNRCRYPMGLHFLVTLRETMGEEAWLSALRALYLEFGYERLHDVTVSDIEDEVVYRVFMKHAPPHLVDVVRDVFRRLHGGPFVDR